MGIYAKSGFTTLRVVGKLDFHLARVTWKYGRAVGATLDRKNEEKMQNKKITLTTLSLAALMTLAACGGGGGGSSASNTGTTAPATGSSTPASNAASPATSVPAPTYASASTQSAAFNALNNYRQAMGVGLLAQDAVLDTSAQSHAAYLNANLANGNITALSHNEVSTFTDFYEVTPLSRARKAGAPATEWIWEDIAAGQAQANAAAYASDCVGQFLNTVYHLQGVTSVQQTIGIGFQQNTSQGTYACSLDFGETTGVSGNPSDNSVNLSAGQQMPTTAIAISPLPGETGVARLMTAETPNPAPDLSAPGRPVLVRVTAMNQGDVLTVQSFTLTSAGGTVVPARVIVPSAALSGSTSGVTADVNNELFQGVAVLLPLAALAPNTTYSVKLNASRNGSPISKSSTFTTGN
ncbi:CAP domain-containing protein (plasmid) [Paraburkholderia sp. D15]|uniref:CAP domain-containing protein n=1 Tax=Paraburkholderia sp. D15 TaxID=2880218 RepID=UPI002478F916|nr:CAP domain-containing protein [Paraburkholderia sp. D15]WGS55104.1 CAP domain-containing protein [Paraburkholderia sp. D15]